MTPEEFQAMADGVKPPAPTPPVSKWDFLSHLPGVGPSIESMRQQYMEPGAKMFHQASEDSTGVDIGSLVPQLKNDPTIGSVPYNFLRMAPAAAAALPLEMEAQLAHSMPENIATMGAGSALKAAGVFPAIGSWLRNVPGVQTASDVNKGVGSALTGAYDKVHDTISSLLHPYGGWTQEGEQAVKNLEGRHTISQINNTKIGQDLQTGGTGVPLPSQEQIMMRHLMEQKNILATGEAMFQNGENTPLNSAALQEMFNSQFKVNPDTPDITGFEVPQNLTLPVENYFKIARRAAQAFGPEMGTEKEMIASGLIDPTGFLKFHGDIGYSPQVQRQNSWGIMPTLQSGIRENSDFLKARTALTSAKRAEMGFVPEPGGPTTLRLIQEQRLIDTRNFFNDMAQTPTVSHPPATPGEMDLPEGLTMDTGSGKFTKLPVRDSLGPLAGQMVRAPEAKTIMGMADSMDNSQSFGKDLYTTWRFLHTVTSPATWLRVTFGHAMMAHAAGVSPFDMDVWRTAVKEMTSGAGPYWDMAQSGNVPGSWTTQGAASALNDLMSAADMKNQKSINDSLAMATSKWLRHNPASEWMKQGYHDMQALPKHAVFIRAVQDGMPVGDAIQKAEQAIINYGEVPEWIKKSRTSIFYDSGIGGNGQPGTGLKLPGIPFLSFSYGVTPRIAQAVIENPMIFSAYHQFAKAWNTLASESAGVTPPEKAEIEKLYPNAMPMVMPFRNSVGHLLVHDVTPMTPIRDLMGASETMGNESTGGNPIARFSSGAMTTLGHVLARNPVLGTASALLTGKNPQFGNQFAGPLGEAQDLANVAEQNKVGGPDLQKLTEAMQQGEVGPRLQFLWNQAAPPPLGQNLENVIHAAMGRQNMIGLHQTVPEALGASLVGPTRDVYLDDIMNKLKLEHLVNQGMGAVMGQARDAAHYKEQGKSKPMTPEEFAKL